jgi:MoaA/NifB/PqqE/SkfB family radical SAM enzyme/glycosyltransferase involved in cell wall biosynthesis
VHCWEEASWGRAPHADTPTTASASGYSPSRQEEPSLRICLVTRGDLFPPNHGAAVKIVRTAEHLSRVTGAPSFVVTDDRDHYLRWDDGKVQEVPYSLRFRAAEEWPPLPHLSRLSERLCRAVGYPPDESFLYRPLFDPTWWARALEVGRREGIDVFQAEFPGYTMPAAVAAGLLGGLRRARGGRSPITSVVQHNVEWDRLTEFGHTTDRVRSVELSALSLVQHVIAVSDLDRQRMVSAGLDASRVTVIPHGVEVGVFQTANGAGIRARYGIDPAAPLLFFHGTLHYWPNTEAVRWIVLELLPRLLPEMPKLRVLICGMNPPLYYTHAAVIFAGPVPDLAAHVVAADLCLCPITAGGGTRMKLLEYMAAGRPIVSTTKGAEGIAYTDGQHLCIADGADAFAEAARALLHDRPRAQRLGAAAARFAARYDWSEIARAYCSLYAGEGAGADWNHRLAHREPAPRPPLIDAHLPARQASKPLTMLLLLNRGCNLRCSFCDLWDDPAQLSLEAALPLLDEAVAIGTKVLVLTGGEPFLHKDLFRVVAAAKARGLAVNITTNGTRIQARWEELIHSGVDSLSFSLDGLAETHDRLRGQKGAWKRTLAGLDRVRERGGVATSVYFTANRENVGELEAVYALATERGASFDFWPVNDAPALAFQSPADQAAWRAVVARMAAQDPAVAARAAYLLQGLDHHAGSLGAVRCLGFIDQYGVKYTGELIPCCVWGAEGLVVGNVFEKPLRELWWSEGVQRYRRRLHAEGCTAGCFNHSLYEFERSTGQSFRMDLGEH